MTRFACAKQDTHRIGAGKALTLSAAPAPAAAPPWGKGLDMTLCPFFLAPLSGFWSLAP